MCIVLVEHSIVKLYHLQPCHVQSLALETGNNFTYESTLNSIGLYQYKAFLHYPMLFKVQTILFFVEISVEIIHIVDTFVQKHNNTLQR